MVWAAIFIVITIIYTTISHGSMMYDANYELQFLPICEHAREGLTFVIRNPFNTPTDADIRSHSIKGNLR